MENMDENMEVTFLLYGTAAVHIIWFRITPMVSDLLIGLGAVMMIVSVTLYIVQNIRTFRTISQSISDDGRTEGHRK